MDNETNGNSRESGRYDRVDANQVPEQHAFPVLVTVIVISLAGPGFCYSDEGGLCSILKETN